MLSPLGAAAVMGDVIKLQELHFQSIIFDDMQDQVTISRSLCIPGKCILGDQGKDLKMTHFIETISFLGIIVNIFLQQKT